MLGSLDVQQQAMKARHPASPRTPCGSIGLRALHGVMFCGPRKAQDAAATCMQPSTALDS
jgi:hypothetical protein